MKKYIITLAVSAFMLTACKTKKEDGHGHDHESTHQHEDGTVHESHSETPEGQQEFTVDTTLQNKDTLFDIQHQHDHENKHEHSHN
ncbi:MAG: hypothetical protein ACKVPJ_00015 [Chitinophagales bacterium]